MPCARPSPASRTTQSLDSRVRTALVESLLEDCIRRGNTTAELLLGRALSGVDTQALPASLLTTGQNLRRGAALLLRAADAGADARHGWSSTASMQTTVRRFPIRRWRGSSSRRPHSRARLCAQRRLGALILRSATTVHESEQGIRWLHQAARRQDALAAQLLGSLVLPGADPTPKPTRPSMPYAARTPGWPAACGQQGTSA
jgi:TPR repeat protein